MKLNLKKELESLTAETKPSSWKHHEHVKGYGIFALPLSSGYTMALRVFPVNDFAPYITVWIQTPDGKWTIYYDAVSADIACPRYYGKTVDSSVPAKIRLNWYSGSMLSIYMEKPEFECTVSMEEPMFLRMLNAVSKRMPLWTWRFSPFLNLRQWMASKLGMGDIKLKGRFPSGHSGILMPQRMYFIKYAHVLFEGMDLGTPVAVKVNPKIGDMPLPARGVLAIGGAEWEILDSIEYNEVRLAAKLSMELINKDENEEMYTNGRVLSTKVYINQ